MSNIPINDHDALIERVTASAFEGNKEIVFLVGAPLSAVASTKTGTLDVDGIIQLIREQFSNKIGSLSEFNKQVAKGTQYRYQAAFDYLLARRGQDVANSIIQRAVLHAHADRDTLISSLDRMVETDYKRIESDPKGWTIPPAVQGLATLAVRHPTIFGRRILTSNFDPLIEIAIRASGGTFYRTVLAGDGSINNTESSACNIVHLHGYWYGSDTLHTPRQLLQDRPNLRSSLSQLLSNSVVVVLAYGGWDDIFINALASVLDDGNSSPDILWAFHEKKTEKIRQQNRRLLSRLAPGLVRGRVNLYSGIDCHLFLPILTKSLERSSQSAQGTPVAISTPADPGGPVPIPVTIRPSGLPADLGMSDSPPRVDAWVGRDIEFKAITNSTQPITVISGIGGQGKSALASMCFEHITSSHKIDFWDWRDCREEGDRLNTQLSSIIGRLTNGEISATDLEGLETESLIETLLKVVGNKFCLFVFDNIDHYIDLESFRPISSIRLLFQKVLSRKHNSRFVFTCRPNIKSDDPGILPIPLTEGLSHGETTLLFQRRGVNIADNSTLVLEAWKLTNGHPLWLNLIAVQVASGRTSLPRILEGIKRGQGALPENTLDEIWKTLKEKQIIILRLMAEMVRPETEDRISEYVRVRHINYAQFSKHKGILIALNLIVVKPVPSQPDRLELHPLIRQYIRAKFPQAEQEKYIATILVVIDRMIGQFISVLKVNRGAWSFDMIEHWTQKAELSIKKRDFKSATKTLNDIGPQLLIYGLPEVLVRVSRQLFDAIDWAKEFQGGSGPIDSALKRYVGCLTQLGERQEVEALLKKYEASIPGKGAQFVNLCDMRCYFHWYSEEYRKAIDWGEEGVALKESTSADIASDCAHNLALAQRDFGELEKALKYFSKNIEVSEAISPENLDSKQHASVYGNIGRCLQLGGEIENAMACLKKSAYLLEGQSPEPLRIVNQGYARSWIGEGFVQKGLFKEAYLFMKSASHKWEIVSPPRASRQQQKITELLAKFQELLQHLTILDAEEVEHECRRWIFGKAMRT